MKAKRIFGSIPGIEVGTHFKNRVELHAAGVHRPLQAGISGSEAEGADSIVISGGYEDDQDSGDIIIYTGHGGNDPRTKEQTVDQELARGNLALAKSCDSGLPVRGAGGNNAQSPKAGYRYDGLYYIERYWSERGRAGRIIWRYRLVKSDDDR